MKLYGILHDAANGDLTVRTAKLLKVSIGVGKGKDMHVHINPLGKWMLTVGSKVTPFETREACEEAYGKAKAVGFPERKFPKKLPYFTFTRPGADGYHEPDFGAIAAHGPMPKEMDVVLSGTLEQIFRPEMNMWGAKELQCKGDGLKGQRLVTLAKTPQEKARIVPGQRYFDVDVCFVGGCPYSQGDAPPCKPHASMYFQLSKFPVVGGSTGYDTSGYAGIKALGGVLETTLPGGAVANGMVMTMGLRQYTPRKGSGAAWHATLRGTGVTLPEFTPALAPPPLAEMNPEDQASMIHTLNAEFAGDE